MGNNAACFAWSRREQGNDFLQNLLLLLDSKRQCLCVSRRVWDVSLDSLQCS